MVKYHKNTGNSCLICCSDVKKGITLHKTRRQTHKLCIDCACGYLSPIFKQKINNLKDKINETDFFSCPGSYDGEFRNICNHKVLISKLTPLRYSPILM